MKKIAIFQRDFSAGGIQKSLLNLLQNIDLENYEIDLYLFGHDNFFAKKIDSRIKIEYLNRLPKFCQFIPFNLLKNKKIISIDKQYDVAIDFNGYDVETALGALNVKADKKFILCHSDYFMRSKKDYKFFLKWYLNYRFKYRFFDKTICVSKGAEAALKIMLKNENINSFVVSNLIDTDEIVKKSKEKISMKIDQNKYNLVSVGELISAKGFDILINIMHSVVKKRQDIHLYIIGDGADKQKLIKQVEHLKLNEYISFLGRKTSPFPYLNKMDGFVLTSRYEGQGMVVLEAKTLGLDIFVSKHLEKYLAGIKGVDGIEESLIRAKRHSKNIDYLVEYNMEILHKWNILL